MFEDEWRRIFGGMSDSPLHDLFAGMNSGPFCEGMPRQNHPFERIESSPKPPEQIFAEVAKYGLEKQVEAFQVVVREFFLKQKEFSEEIKELQKENKQFQKDNRELADVVREREIEIAELQRTVENLNTTLDNALSNDDEISANDKTPTSNETSADNERNKTSPADSLTDSPGKTDGCEL